MGFYFKRRAVYVTITKNKVDPIGHAIDDGT